MKKNANRLCELFQFAKDKSPYYGNLYHDLERSFCINNFGELFKNLPFVDSSIYLKPKEEIMTDLDSKFYVFTSGGTTSKPKFIYLTPQELHNNIKYHGFAYKSAGIETTDRVATFGLPGFLTSEFTVYLGLEECECSILPIGVFDYSYIAEYIVKFDINTLLVMPTDIVNFINYLKENNLSLTIPKVITGGEPLYPSIKDYIKKELNTVKFGSTYQSMDFGTVGYQDDNCDYNEYWVQSNLQYVEIIKEDGTEAKEGESGELVVTNLGRKLIPIIRYKTGDLVTLITKSPNLKIRYERRITNVIKIGGEKIEIDILEKCLSVNDECTGKFQAVVSKVNNKDTIKILVECHDSELENRKWLKENIKDFIKVNSIKLNTLISHGLVNEVEVLLERKNSDNFVYSNGTGKLKRIIDLRN